MQIKLKEVISRKELDVFIRFPDKLYRHCEYYVPALHSHQKSTLRKDKNPAFEHCDARYWLAYSGKEIVGRVAAIINHQYNLQQGIKYMRFGWLDFIEDEDVLQALIRAVESWARETGMEYVHGPLGFISFDASGVLVEGFDELPTSWGRYNYPYYARMLESMSYTKDVDWVEQLIYVPDELPVREINAAQIVKNRYALRSAVIRNKNDIRKYAAELFYLLNDVYEELYCFSKLSNRQIDELVGDFLHIVSPKFVSVILNDRDEIVAFGIVIPSLSKALQKAKGRLFPFGYFHLRKALKKNDRVDMLLIGVKSEYRNKGVHALLFEKIIPAMYDMGIRYVETTRELETNQKVQQLWEPYKKRMHKRARCYVRKLS
ncbi:MAG: hypothetical protein EA394_04170 [Bacteroidia bacterium]|nr:MAG: hypothetical protein EA394_04170 [Bacteroidia bacterium]